ncbi:MAG: hypothetical protein E6G48_04405 [Actinobacteria bacterium]|nr:MAG: hypothetical protein E6G48_04405 [Actinomycetota bacterium]
MSDVHAPGHRHSHGSIDPSIKRSRAGIRAVGQSLAVLLAAAGLQAAIYVATSSIALLADLIHNFGDALTAVPLATAFLLRSARAERWAGYAVVFAILVSACVAAGLAVNRLLNPEPIEHLLALAIAGLVGFAGNEAAALMRLRARADAIVRLAVVISALVVALGANVADPIIGLMITIMILRITWQSWRTVRSGHDD